MAMIEDQIISNVTCDAGKQTKISSFLKSEEISTKPWGKFHLLFQSPSLSSRSLLFSRFSPSTLSLIFLSSFQVFCSQFAIVTLHAVSCSCVHVVRAFLFGWSLMSYFHRFLILFFFSSSLFFPLFSLSFILSFLTLLYGFILSVMVLSCIEPAWCVHLLLAMHLLLESNCYVVLLY